MNFVSQHRRLAMYLRDGLACAYCGSGVEDGIKLTLDHIIPYSLGGGNTENNLVTCCGKCNSSRGNRPADQFAEKVAGYIDNGTTGEQIMAHIQNCLNRPSDVKAAKEMVARRGSCAKVIQSLN